MTTSRDARPREGGVMIPGGSFTVDGGAWLDAPPARCDLTSAQLADLLRLAIAGQPIPAQYGYAGPQEILSDLHLVGANAVRAEQRRAEYAERAGADARLAHGRAWRLVLDAHKRKTLRTDDVRAALGAA